MTDDINFMKQALVQAKLALTAGEIPIGAYLIKDGEVIAVAYNRREASKNPLDHAEMQVLREAGKKLNDWRLTGCTLYVTLEPCPMCLGALFQARIDRLVFGCEDPKRDTKSDFPSLLYRLDPHTHQSTLKSNNHLLNITGLVLQEECSQILKDFFKKRREEVN